MNCQPYSSSAKGAAAWSFTEMLPASVWTDHDPDDAPSLSSGMPSVGKLLPMAGRDRAVSLGGPRVGTTQWP